MSEYEDFISEESKSWLEHIGQLESRIESCGRMMEIVGNLAEPKGIDYSNIPGTGINKDALADAIALKDELTGAWRDERMRLMSELDEALGIIYRLDSNQCAVLLYRYIAHMEWSEVADSIGYSEDHCYRLHRSALLSVHRFLPSMWRTEFPKAT